MKRFIVYFLLAFAVCSCTNDTTNDNSPGGVEDVEIVDRIYASINVTKDSSEAEKNLQKLWAVADSVRVVGPNTNKGYLFDEGIAKRSGNFTITTDYDLLEYSFANNEYYALARGEFKVDPQIGLCCYSDAEGTCVQRYNSTGENEHLLLATSKDGKKFTFSTVLGFLRVPIMGDKVVKSIELANNEDKYISGRYYFAANDYEQLRWDRNVERKYSIMLDCGEGVQLMNTPTDFYFALQPIELKKGVYLNITFTDGTTYVHNYNKSVKVVQNEALSIGKFNTASGNTQIINIKCYGNTFWVPRLEGSLSLSGFITFGDGESKAINSVERHIYTDGKESHDASFVIRGATTITMKNCEGITRLDLSNF